MGVPLLREITTLPVDSYERQPTGLGVLSAVPWSMGFELGIQLDYVCWGTG